MHLLPVVPVVASLIAGVALSGRWPRAGALAELLVGALAIGLAAALAGRRRALALAFLIATALPLGWEVGARAHARAIERPLREGLREHLAAGREGEVVLVEGRLMEDALPSEGEAVVLLDVHRVRVERGPWQYLRGGVRLGVPTGATTDPYRHWRRGRCIRAPALLRVPGTFRNPGVSDADLQLARRGFALVGQVKSASLVEPCGAAPGWVDAAGKVRDGIRRAVQRHVGAHSPRSAAIVTAILIGDRAAIDADVEERLRRAGTFHVIAISGGNIAILTGMLFWILVGLRAPPRWVAVTSIVSLSLYGLCVVRGASVDRAIAVAATWLGAGIFDVRAHPLALLASVAGALVLADPLVVFDPGFALTFGATLGLVALTPPLMGWWRSPASSRGGDATSSTIVAFLATSVIATVAAEAGVLPIGAVAFGRVSLAGIALNLVAVPMMALAQGAGMVTVLFAGWADPAAAATGWVAHLGVWCLVESARLVEVMPWVSRAVPPPSGWLLLGYVAALSGTAAPTVAPRVRLGCASVALCGALVIFAGWWPAAERPIVDASNGRARGEVALRVTFLDVGQGDATVVQFPRGRVMLVDTGGLAGAPRFDMARRVVSPALHALGRTSARLAGPDPRRPGSRRRGGRDHGGVAPGGSVGRHSRAPVGRARRAAGAGGAARELPGGACARRTNCWSTASWCACGTRTPRTGSVSECGTTTRS